MWRTSSLCYKFVQIGVIFCSVLFLILLRHWLVYKTRVSHLDIFSSNVCRLWRPILLILLHTRVHLDYLLRLLEIYWLGHHLYWLIHLDYRGIIYRDLLYRSDFPFFVVLFSSLFINHKNGFMDLIRRIHSLSGYYLRLVCRIKNLRQSSWSHILSLEISRIVFLHYVKIVITAIIPTLGLDTEITSPTVLRFK